MPPSPPFYPSGMRVTDSGDQGSNHPPTSPLDVLFFIGLAIVSVFLTWFSVYVGLKIYVLVKKDTPGSGIDWSAFGCAGCRRRKASGKSHHIFAADIPAPAWTTTPSGELNLNSPTLDGTPNPGKQSPKGLGIDLGDEHGDYGFGTGCVTLPTVGAETGTK